MLLQIWKFILQFFPNCLLQISWRNNNNCITHLITILANVFLPQKFYNFERKVDFCIFLILIVVSVSDFHLIFHSSSIDYWKLESTVQKKCILVGEFVIKSSLKKMFTLNYWTCLCLEIDIDTETKEKSTKSPFSWLEE